MPTTESQSPRFAGIDSWDSRDVVLGIVEGQFAAIAAVQTAAGAIAEAIDRAAERLERGGRLIYMGAGTSGRVAAQDAAELPPTFNWPPERAIALLAGGKGPANAADESAEDDGTLAQTELTALAVGPDDVVIAIAASGATPYALAGIEHAKAMGALTIGILNNPDRPLGELADIAIVLATGSEFLAGSTRLKAGTAQKAALNCISTGIMIRLGLVYRGMMVEMRPTNTKLQVRAAGMVASLTGADAEIARAALDMADGSIKLATLMLAKSVDLPGAASLLAAADGNLRRAME